MCALFWGTMDVSCWLQQCFVINQPYCCHWNLCSGCAHERRYRPPTPHTHNHTHIHTQTHTRTRTCTHTHTYTYTCTNSLSLSLSLFPSLHLSLSLVSLSVSFSLSLTHTHGWQAKGHWKRTAALAIVLQRLRMRKNWRHVVSRCVRPYPGFSRAGTVCMCTLMCARSRRCVFLCVFVCLCGCLHVRHLCI